MIKSIKNYRRIWYFSFCALLTRIIVAEKWKRKGYVLPLRVIIWLQDDTFRSIEYFKPYILMCVSLTLGWQWKGGSFIFFFFSYCSILLLSNDAKLFTRIAASRLEQLLPSVINADQTEFIQWKRLADNIYHLLRKLGFPDWHQAGDKLRGWRMFDQLVCISFRRKLNSTLIRFETWREPHLDAKPPPLVNFVVKRTRHIQTLISDCTFTFSHKYKDYVSLTNTEQPGTGQISILRLHSGWGDNAAWI